MAPIPPLYQAPVVVGRRNRGELDRNDVACSNQSVRIVCILRTTTLQDLRLLLHCMDGVASMMAKALPSSGVRVISVLLGTSGSAGICVSERLLCSAMLVALPQALRVIAREGYGFGVARI
jgi:hypothetical protein